MNWNKHSFPDAAEETPSVKPQNENATSPPVQSNFSVLAAAGCV